jgi:hypothetical protein
MFDSVIDRIERDERISTLAEKLKGSAQPLIGDGLVRDVLTGRWLGHPAHPAVVLAPLAGWFAGTLLDVVGGPSARRSSSAPGRCRHPRRAAGGGDRRGGVADHDKAEERIGTVHAALADTTTVMFATSWVLRTRRRHRAAVATGLAGAALAGVTAFMGGHLSYRRGVGVTTVAFQSGPEDWEPLELDAEPSRRPSRSWGRRRPSVCGRRSAVVRRRRRSAARDGVAVQPSRRSAARRQGRRRMPAVPVARCPIRSRTGEVRRGPASAAQPVYDVVDDDGRLSIRRTEHGSLRGGQSLEDGDVSLALDMTDAVVEAPGAPDQDEAGDSA